MMKRIRQQETAFEHLIHSKSSVDEKYDSLNEELGDFIKKMLEYEGNPSLFLNSKLQILQDEQLIEHVYLNQQEDLTPSNIDEKMKECHKTFNIDIHYEKVLQS